MNKRKENLKLQKLTHAAKKKKEYERDNQKRKGEKNGEEITRTRPNSDQ